MANLLRRESQQHTEADQSIRKAKIYVSFKTLYIEAYLPVYGKPGDNLI